MLPIPYDILLVCRNIIMKETLKWGGKTNKMGWMYK
jgi:hypothetical protein